MTNSDQALRIIDANLNRAAEGLRVLEEFARMVLNDTLLTEKLKTMRHQIVRGDFSFQKSLVQARDSEGDVGINLAAAGEKKEKELPSIIVANSRRAQESLRVLEELAKLPGLTLDSEKFKQARFDLYTIERTLLARLLRQDKIQKIKGLYAIVDTQALEGRSHTEAAAQVLQGGAKILQLRDKVLKKHEVLAIAVELKKLCADNSALFIMNDYLDVALASDADGLHIGQDDLPVAAARKLLPIDKILGCSVKTAAQAVAAEADGADYVAPGAIYATTSKDDTEVIGLEPVKEIKKAVKVPVVAIGGINTQNAAAVITAGADAAAVISAILKTENIELATRQLIASLRKEK